MKASRLLHAFLLILAFEAATAQTDTLTDRLITLTDAATASAATDSLSADSLNHDTVPPRQSMLDHPVNYHAADSMVMDLKNEKIYLYGDAEADYGDIKLNAAFIEIELSSSELAATSLPDSSGQPEGYPVFTQGDQTFESHEMRYNFKSQRGLSKMVKTQEGDGYLHGEVVKKDTGNVIYIQNGKYTTCDLDDPHFYFRSRKLKVVQRKNIVSGPAYLSLGNLPTPLAIPFGFFPNTEERSSGIIVPAPGESPNQGFYLNRGGYYLGLSERFDLSLTADIYSRGSWAGYVQTNYAKRYRYKGSFEMQAIKIIFGSPEFPNYRNDKLRYKLLWEHSQDRSAHPNRTFSASVNFGSPDADRVNLQSSTNAYLRSSSNSNIRFSKSFPNSPFSFSAAASSSQNATTGLTALSLPTAALNMSRINPFKNEERIGNPRPWEDIGIQSSLNFDNKANVRADSLLTTSTLRAFNYSAKGSATISSNYKVLRYITLTPSVANNIALTPFTTVRSLNAENLVETDTVRTVGGYWNGSANVALTTKLYALYLYKSERVKAMRHVSIPTLSLSYSPDYTSPAWGYFRTVADSLGREQRYSIFDGTTVSAPPAKGNGVVNFNWQNSFELKLLNAKDTTGKNPDKKLMIIDNFGLSTNYKLAEDSARLAPMAITLRSKAVKGFSVQSGATLNPYVLSAAGRRTGEYMVANNGKLGHWTNANLTIDWTAKPSKTSAASEKKKTQVEGENYRYDDFLDFDIPWNVRLGYNLVYSRPSRTVSVTQTLRVNGDVSLTRNWKVSGSTNLDLRNLQFSYSQLTLVRDLHCWQISIDVVPFGDRKQYSIEIRPKSSLLQDLKLARTRRYFE